MSEGVNNPADITQVISDIADLQSDIDDLQSDVTDIIADLVTIEQETYETEHHLHNWERWFGLAAAPSGTNWGDLAGLTPYRVISGNGAFGTDPNDEALVLGTDDTPAIAGNTKFDPHRLVITAASNANDWVLRIICGSGTMADAESAGQYSDVMLQEARKGSPVGIIMKRCDSGVDKIWIRAKNGTNNATLDFFIGIHEYER